MDDDIRNKIKELDESAENIAHNKLLARNLERLKLLMEKDIGKDKKKKYKS